MSLSLIIFPFVSSGRRRWTVVGQNLFLEKTCKKRVFTFGKCWNSPRVQSLWTCPCSVPPPPGESSECHTLPVCDWAASVRMTEVRPKRTDRVNTAEHYSWRVGHKHTHTRAYNSISVRTFPDILHSPGPNPDPDPGLALEAGLNPPTVLWSSVQSIQNTHIQV